MFNTPLGRESFYDDSAIRKSATLHGVLVVTTLTAAAATVQAIRALRERALDVLSSSRRSTQLSSQGSRGRWALKKLYLALAGGGAHAAAHAGVLRRAREGRHRRRRASRA